MKKFFVVGMMLVAGWLFGCVETTTAILPDLTGMSRLEISETMERLGIQYVFKFSKKICKTDAERDQFVEYQTGYQAGDEIAKDYQIYIYTTVLPLTINRLDEVKIDFVYEGKNFVKDGVAKVTLSRTIDGDTAWFQDTDGAEVKVRFLGIDTPETAYSNDPWGKAASTYVSNRLRSAKEIVLESDGARTETYGRYLAYVWVDNELLNLDIVQQAYSNCTLGSSYKYGSLLREVATAVSKTGRRFFGEVDPNYIY